MVKSRVGACRVLVPVALLFSWTLVSVQPRPALAEVATVTGSGYGYFSRISLFGGPAADQGPAPTVTLPAGGSASPVTATAPTGNASYGPGIFFTSGPLTVSTQGTTGPTGSVTTSTDIQTVNTSGAEVLTASRVTSTCTAAESGVSGSTTITGGTLQTSDGDPNIDGDETVVAVPANPPANTTFEGVLNSVGDTFRYVFNEQIVNADGSLTVNAGHQYAIGPTAIGDLIIGQSICGVTATGAPPPTTTTTIAPTTTTTTAPTTTTTAAPATGSVGGGAYGYYTKISLFGGAPGFRGPAPTVTLPAAGSATPITASAATGDARYGPGIFFTSGPIEVSTEGTPAAGEVKSSTKITTVNTSDQEVLTATGATSTCTASKTGGTTGSATITAGRLQLSAGDPDVDGDPGERFVDVPANPEPNKTYEGKLESVGDTFRYVFNEQIVKDGTITVNAAHQYALGPTAIGELIVGQSVCSLKALDGGGGGGGGGGTNVTSPAGSLAATGSTTGPLVRLGLGLGFVLVGLMATWLGRGRRRTSADEF